MSNNLISIHDPKLKLDVLSPEEIQAIHAASLWIIENVGIRFPSKQALEIWSAHGASVDSDKKTVRARPDLIEQALSTCPPEYKLAGRDRNLDLPLDGNHVFLGTDGCGVEIIDIHTKAKRSSCLADVRDIARIADGTNEIGFHWVPVSAQDMPATNRSLHEIKAIWENSTKHVQTESIYSAKEASAAVEMASLIAGGKEKLKDWPLLSLMECTAPPLSHDGGSVDAALVAAQFGLPTGFMTMAACLTTGPATMAGTLASGNAEVIAGTALLQLAYPGTPVFYAAAQTASDLRTGAYTGGGPEDFLFGAATNLLADFYNIPLSMGSFATGAKEPNWQAGLENSLSTFMAGISMADMLLGCGFLHGSRIWSYAEMMLDCEIFTIIKKMVEGIAVNVETLALDTIAAVGPGGNFLSQKHTLKHMHDLYLPQFLDRRPYSDWELKKDDAQDWALTKARKFLTNHRPEELDPKICAEMEKVIQCNQN